MSLISSSCCSPLSDIVHVAMPRNNEVAFLAEGPSAAETAWGTTDYNFDALGETTGGGMP